MNIEELIKLNRPISEAEAKEYFSGEGLPVLPSVLVKDRSDIENIDFSFDYPVAMKIVSPEIQHKTEAGGVLLNIKNSREAQEGFTTIIDSVKQYNPDADIQGVLITPMVTGGIEVIIGMYKNEQLGNIVMYGLGGVYVELFKDVAFRAVPFDRVEAERMIDETRSKKLLEGFRGDARKNIEGVVEILLRVSEISEKNECIKAIDLNPIIVKEKEAWILDTALQLENENGRNV